MSAGASVLLLSNPHNPTGTVPSREELVLPAQLSEQYGVRVISDEIHAPLTLGESRSTPYLDIADDIAIAVHSASKAGNIAGLRCGLAVGKELPSYGSERGWTVGHLDVIASIAAYRRGKQWINQLLLEPAGNTEVVTASLSRYAPSIACCSEAASYFAWLDFRELRVADDDLSAFITDHAQVKLSDGGAFGRRGVGWARMTIGTLPAIVDEAIQRIARTTFAPMS